jgi:hypothetical protein
MRFWLLALVIPQALYASELIYKDLPSLNNRTEKISNVIIDFQESKPYLKVVAKTIQCKIPVSSLTEALTIQSLLANTSSSWLQCYGNLLQISKAEPLMIETSKFMLGQRAGSVAPQK